MLLIPFEKIYFMLEIDKGDKIPKVCAKMESPPKDKIAVIQTSCICVGSGA